MLFDEVGHGEGRGARGHVKVLGAGVAAEAGLGDDDLAVLDEEGQDVLDEGRECLAETDEGGKNRGK